MEYNTKNTHKIELEKWSIHAQMSLLLYSIEKYKNVYILDNFFYYKSVDRMLSDFWKWIEEKDSNGTYSYNEGSASSWEKLEDNYMSANYFYFNHITDWHEMSHYLNELKKEKLVLLNYALGYVIYNSVNSVLYYDLNIRKVDIDLPSDMYNFDEEENFFAVLNTIINLADNPKQEEAWQKKALQKLHKYHNVKKVGEWGPPITKDFFNDIEA